jgi:TRAP-type transport system small permease protein
MGMLQLIDKTAELIGAFLMALICFTVFIGVLFRYILNSPLGWIEEVARYCLVLVTYFGAYLALRRSQHMTIDLFYNQFSKKNQRLISIAGLLIIMPFFVALSITGYQYSVAFIDQRTPFLGIPYGFIYLILPVTGILFIIATLVELTKRCRGDK